MSSGVDVSLQVTWNSDINGKAILHGKMLHLIFSGYGKTFSNTAVVATLPESMVPLSTLNGWYRGSGIYINASSVIRPIQIGTFSTNRTINIVNAVAESMISPYGDILIELE